MCVGIRNFYEAGQTERNIYEFKLIANLSIIIITMRLRINTYNTRETRNCYEQQPFVQLI